MLMYTAWTCIKLLLLFNLNTVHVVYWIAHKCIVHKNCWNLKLDEHKALYAPINKKRQHSYFNFFSHFCSLCCTYKCSYSMLHTTHYSVYEINPDKGVPSSFFKTSKTLRKKDMPNQPTDRITTILLPSVFFSTLLLSWRHLRQNYASDQQASSGYILTYPIYFCVNWALVHEILCVQKKSFKKMSGKPSKSKEYKLLFGEPVRQAPMQKTTKIVLCLDHIKSCFFLKISKLSRYQKFIWK